MAKVTGPLMSISASGKLADSLVFFAWKGVNVVRGWVKPSNPERPAQGDQRIKLGGTGRSVAEIKPAKQFAQQLVDLNLIPGGQTKQSFLVKYILDHYIYDSTTYTAMLAALTGHGVYAAWGASADTLGIVEFDLAYAAIAPYNKALGLYLIARASIALAFVGTPYTTALASWVTADITGMVSDFTT